MNLDQVMQASEVLDWFATQAGVAGEGAQERARMALHLRMCQLYLLEYASHVANGAEPYDALMSTARGELKLTPQQQDLWRAMTPPATG